MKETPVTVATQKRLVPLGTNLLVRRAPRETNRGGIVIPDNAQREQDHAVIVAIGPGKTNEHGWVAIPTELTVGAEILITRYAGIEVEENGEAMLLIDAGEVIGVYVEHLEPVLIP